MSDVAGAGVLRLTGVAKRFGGLVALDDLSLAFDAGGIAALVGPNGAGKTTVFNVVSGIYRPDHGSLAFDGRALPLGRPDRIAALGVARTFQNLRLFAFMSALENVMVGEHVRLRANLLDSLLHTPRHRSEEHRARSRARELLRFVGLERHADAYARSLAYGFARRLEIARALASDPKLLLLDEPAAGTNPREKERLVELVERIRATGIGVVIIEHDMAFVAALCKRVVVLDRGAIIADGTPAQIRQNPAVIDAYLGRQSA